jgi:hypothetical protein
MAFGQIDPARLEGDALTSWYLRSPAEIAEERRKASEQAYNAFFDQSGETQADPQTADDHASATSADAVQPMWRQVGPNRWRSDSTVPGRPPQGENISPDGSYQLAAAASPGFWDYWGYHGCQNCHGYTPQTLPPVGGHGLFPPNYSPRIGGGSGGSSPEPRREKYPQCEMQERQDRGICAQQPTEPAKAVCNASATERRAWCDNHQGEIGTPRLDTAYRKSGRPWP